MSKPTNRSIVLVLLLIGAVATIIGVFVLGLDAIAPHGHGSLRGYSYNTTDTSLQKAVWSVINNNPAIEKDTTRGSDGSMDYYNDSVNYITIKIKAQQGNKYQYTFRYYGDSELRASTKISELFVCYAEGSSEGNDGFRGRKEQKNMLLALFEEQFIRKLDSTLNLQHTIN